MQFWLGTHLPQWLSRIETPLFVSNRTLSRYKKLPVSIGRWALDSGGFSELGMYGEWRTSQADYVASCRRYRSEIGNLEWCAVQDWMCEPFILKKTGLSIEAHQLRTIRSFLELMAIAPEVPWVPVVQGWSTDDYLRHVDLYEKAGINLPDLSLVGIGSVCRRQGTKEASQTLRNISTMGINIHGFGLKTTALKSLSVHLASADSLAWSYAARVLKARCGDPSSSCANHMHYALDWLDGVMASIDAGAMPATTQMSMFDVLHSFRGRT